MSGSATDDTSEIDFVGRQPRLGLGVKAVHQARVGASADPVERRLLAKLDAGKKRAARTSTEEESNPSEENVGPCEDDDNSDEDPESRAKAFTKKRAIPKTPLHANKKHK